MGFPVHVASWTTAQRLPPPSTCLRIRHHLKVMSAHQLHSTSSVRCTPGKPFPFRPIVVLMLKYPHCLISSLPAAIAQNNEQKWGAGNGIFGNCVAESLFLLFSEKMTKATTSKNHTESAGKRSSEPQEMCGPPLMSPGCPRSISPFPKSPIWSDFRACPDHALYLHTFSAPLNLYSFIRYSFIHSFIWPDIQQIYRCLVLGKDSGCDSDMATCLEFLILQRKWIWNR